MPLIGNEIKLGSVRGTGMAILAGRVRYSLNAPGGVGVERERERERNKNEEMLKFNMHACVCVHSGVESTPGTLYTVIP